MNGSVTIGTDSGLSSEQLTDPWCDLCYDHTSQKVEADGFCPDCNSFICNTCIDGHKKVPALRNHKILRDEKMPKTQAEKPVKHRKCSEHSGRVNDQYCVDHSTMVCSKCIKRAHQCCKIIAIHILCESISASDIQQFRNQVRTLEQTAVSTKSMLENNVSDIEEQQKDMINDVDNIRDKMIALTEELHANAVAKITETCRQKIDLIANHLTAVSDATQTLDVTATIITDINQSVAAHIGANQFIRLQDCVERARLCKEEIDLINKNLNKTELSFSPAEELTELLSSCKDLGVFKEAFIAIEPPQPVADIIFPQFIEPGDGRAEKRKERDTLKHHIVKTITLSAKAVDDETKCIIVGFDVTIKGEILVADRENKKIKLISSDNQVLSSLPLDSTPLSITVITETTAAVSTTDQQLHFLDISSSASPMIQRSLSLGFWINCMTPYNGNLGIVEGWSKPACVKMIDFNGCELWSASAKRKETFLGLKTEGKLLKDPHSIGVKCIDGKATIMVTDWKKKKIVFLDASDGHVVKTIYEKANLPYNLTADFDGNVYVSYREREEICFWTTDLQQCKPLLAYEDLHAIPSSIVYRTTTDELLISYENSDVIDVFQLS